MVILLLIRVHMPDSVEGWFLLGTEPTWAVPGHMVIQNN